MISNILLSVLTVLFIILLIIFYNYNKKFQREKEQLINIKFEQITEKLKKEQQEEIDYYEKEKRRIETELKQLYAQSEESKHNMECINSNNQQVIKQLNAQEENLKQHLANLKQQKDTILETQTELIKQELAAYRERELVKIQNSISTQQQVLEQKMFDEHQQRLSTLNQDLEEKTRELLHIESVIQDYREKEKVINEAILRQRAIDEQQDFYRVCLSEESIQDIKLLRDIMNKLNLKDHLNKLIYDTYISKPTQEMTKRVLQGEDPSGIYKITRLKTGEIYIGKSTGIKSRWTQHCKTAFDVGTIAHSILHTTIKKDGLENFTFEVVEYVPKDKLSEREKFWIDFYHSKQYGLNEKGG